MGLSSQRINFTEVPREERAAMGRAEAIRWRGRMEERGPESTAPSRTPGRPPGGVVDASRTRHGLTR
jgi:hypothetical protein